MATTDRELIQVRRDEWEAVLDRLARLEANAAPSVPTGVSTEGLPPDAVDGDARPLPRRKLLTGLAAAAAGGAALTVLDASPAAAEPVVASASGTAALQANSIAPGWAGPGSLLSHYVPPSGAIHPASYGAAISGPNGLQVDAAREGTAINATSPTGTAVRATLGNGAPSTAAAIRAVTNNALGLKIDVAGLGDCASVTSAVGKGIIARAPRSQLTLTNYFPSAGPPSEGFQPAVAGELYVDGPGNLWYCIVAGSPGTWRKVAGPATAGGFHVLPAPARVYDSRVGSQPPNGLKEKLPAGGSRTLSLAANSSGVPQGAVAAAVTCLLVNCAAGAGNFTIWANGIPKPAANTMVWGGNAGRFSTPAITAIDPLTQCRVSSSLSTDFVLDVVGYYL